MGKDDIAGVYERRIDNMREEINYLNREIEYLQQELTNERNEKWDLQERIRNLEKEVR